MSGVVYVGPHGQTDGVETSAVDMWHMVCPDHPPQDWSAEDIRRSTLSGRPKVEWCCVKARWADR